MQARLAHLPSTFVSASAPRFVAHPPTRPSFARYGIAILVSLPAVSTKSAFVDNSRILSSFRIRGITTKATSASFPNLQRCTRCPGYAPYSTRTPAVSCTSCSESLSLPPNGSIITNCPSCNALVAPLASVDYYSLFSLPPSFVIEKPLLKRRFLEWQGKVHPDRVHASTDNERQKQYAASWSALVNEAYKTLNTDILRAEYLLRNRGVQIEEQDKMEDPEMLMEILEVREALADANTEHEVKTIRDSNKRECFLKQEPCVVQL